MHRALRRASRQLTELAASESRFRDLTELSADWFWETDAEHRITWISAGGSVATLFGNLPTFGKCFWEIPRVEVEPRALEAHLERLGDRKSTRLNSSHANISYAVFCLKKKKNKTTTNHSLYTQS